MNLSPILLERIAFSGILRLNRPEKLNALSAEMFSLLGEHLTSLKDDPNLRSIIIIGDGDRAFSHGLRGREEAHNS